MGNGYTPERCPDCGAVQRREPGLMTKDELYDAIACEADLPEAVDTTACQFRKEHLVALLKHLRDE